MSAPFAQQGFYFIHLFTHLPVQRMGDVLALLVKLQLHLTHAGFNSNL